MMSETRCRAVFLTGVETTELRELKLGPPDAGELLLRIDAATTCGTDLKVWQRGGHPRMLEVPGRFGHEGCGTIVQVGPDVEDWHSGDRVVVMNSASCGSCRACAAGRENLCSELQYLNGTFAAYLLVPRAFVERSTWKLDESLAPELASLTEPLACVVHGTELCSPEAGAEVFVLGAGPIGLLFTAFLSYRGHRVVSADPNPRRLEIAETLGASRTVVSDRSAASLGTHAGTGAGFDLAIDATGTPAGWLAVFRSTAPGGTACLFGGCRPGTRISLDAERLHYEEICVRGAYHHRPEAVRTALDFLQRSGETLRPLLTDELPISEVASALRGMAAREQLKVVLRP